MHVGSAKAKDQKVLQYYLYLSLFYNKYEENNILKLKHKNIKAIYASSTKSNIHWLEKRVIPLKATIIKLNFINVNINTKVDKPIQNKTVIMVEKFD